MIYPFEVLKCSLDQYDYWNITIKVTVPNGYEEESVGDNRYMYPKSIIYEQAYTLKASSKEEALREVANAVANGT